MLFLWKTYKTVFFSYAIMSLLNLWRTLIEKENYMTRILNYPITSSEDAMTILHFLKKQGYSHQILVNLKKTTEGILLNGVWARVNDRLSSGDLLTIQLVETEASSDILPVAYPLSICYEDEDILVIDKPSHMPIHPSMGNHDNTLANAVCCYMQKEDSFTFRCVNRLDKDTTGLTIIAKHALSAAVLNNQIVNRQIHRTYLAICEGEVPATGTIAAPLARLCDSTIERCVDIENGERAVTHYTTLQYDPAKDLSLVKLQLETGRTHQIRVHMKYIGHPLIGDFLYHPNYDHIHRQALHSYQLKFMHPITNQPLCLQAPLPADMKCLFPLV